MDEEKYPALIVGAPYGGTKEQVPCVWANELEQRGFVVLTFDQVNMGESSGEPRHVFSPDLFAESFSAAVDYLGVQVPFVDREKIGVIGICGSGGFSLAAAAADTRIKAIATASMYDMTDVRGMNNFSKEQLDEFKDKLTRQRWEDYANEMPEYKPFFMQMLMQFQIWIQLLKNGLDSMLCPVASIKMLMVVLQLLLIYQCFNGAI
ncbi:MAG: alpha/beta hydrolase [Lactobacillus paragasseri]